VSFQGDGEHVVVEEEERGQGLVLGPGADVAITGEVVDEGAYFCCTHAAGVALVVEDDEAFDPIAVRALRAGAVVSALEREADELEEFWVARRHRAERVAKVVPRSLEARMRSSDSDGSGGQVATWLAAWCVPWYAPWVPPASRAAMARQLVVLALLAR
jgi:hypothetical protein